MEFFTIIKLVIVALVDVLAFVAVLCGIFPHLPKRMESKLEALMKEYHWLKRTALILFGGLAMAYFTAEVVTGIKGLDEQSPIHQAQMFAEQADYTRQTEIKEHVLNLCPDLRKYASRCATGNVSENASIYAESYTGRINEAMRLLLSEGVNSTNMEAILDRHQISYAPKDLATNLFEMASEFERLANQLPKPIKK